MWVIQSRISSKTSRSQRLSLSRKSSLKQHLIRKENFRKREASEVRLQKKLQDLAKRVLLEVELVA
jgi:hypothetical protein